MKKPRVLIGGSNGYIGTKLCEFLKNKLAFFDLIQPCFTSLGLIPSLSASLTTRLYSRTISASVWVNLYCGFFFPSLYLLLWFLFTLTLLIVYKLPTQQTKPKQPILKFGTFPTSSVPYIPLSRPQSV